jgi:hypothetical protein
MKKSEMGGYRARLFATAEAIWLRISQKSNMGDISKGVAKTL